MLMWPYDAAYFMSALNRSRYHGARRWDSHQYRKRARRQKVKAARRANLRRARS